jgi:deoxyribodipyrimidine photolyase
MINEELVKMARLAQRDDRMATGALYGDLADRIEALIVEKKYLLERVMEQDDRIEQLQQALKDQSSVSDRLAEANEKLTAERDEHWKSFVHWRKEADDRAEQLQAARADAKEAEAYAEELEKRVAFVEEERRKTFQALLKVKKIHDDVETKLAKAVEALRKIGKTYSADGSRLIHSDKQIINMVYIALAEIEGEKE